MQDYLIIARSGRSLSASAKRAGFRVHVLDCFADQDTRQLSETVNQLQCDDQGFSKAQLMQSVSDVLSVYPNTSIVTGSGFEANPELIDALRRLAPVYSNTNETITLLKQPDTFFKLLDMNSIKYPEFLLNYPDNPENYLIKEIASMGGEQVQWCRDVSCEDSLNSYFQKYVDGTVSSAVFLADGQCSRIVGFNKQWQSKQFASMPFLYSGACSIGNVTDRHYDEIERIINCIVKQSGLQGLCGLDYILTEAGEIYVLEVNPRPPASFELHETGTSLFDAHVSCFDDRMKDLKLERCNACRAYVILYAEHDIQIPIDFEWPVWVKDRPSSGARIKKHYPVCTVHVEEHYLSDISEAIQLRRDQIEATLMLFKDAA